MSRLLSHDELHAIIHADLADCSADVRDLFDRYRIVPARVLFARPTTLESAFVVARRGDEVIYYEEVEGGFNSSLLDDAGRIAEHWFGQDSLCGALWPWLSQQKDGPRRTVIETPGTDHRVGRDPSLLLPFANTSGSRPSTPGTTVISQPGVTIFHVLWLTVSTGVSVMVYISWREAGPIARLLIAGAAFVIAVIVTHIVIVYIVTAWVIPRLKPHSRWNREVNAYMASIFPNQWRNPPGA
jgi:hypothetical protein